MVLSQMPTDARPREKLLSRGPAALADAELLALLLRTGTAKMPVLSLAQHVLDSFQGFSGLLAASLPDLQQIKGLGPAKCTEIAAVLEITRRSLAQELAQRPVFDSPEAVKQFLRLKLSNLPHEVFAVLLLDSQHRLIEYRELFRGTINQTSVYPREVVKLALDKGAAALILAHNHPSGLAEPSKADEYLTQNLKLALGTIDVRVLDHLVVGEAGVVSLAERGLM